MNYSFAKFYDINIINDKTLFCPKNIKFKTYSAWKHSLYLLFVYELLFCQILWHSIKRGYYIYFPFSCDFFAEIFKEKDAVLKLEFL